MIRDLRFDEIDRNDRRKRLTRLVVAVVLLSSAVSFGVVREQSIKKEFDAIPTARMGDIESLRTRHAGIETLLERHHIWTGAWSAREELDGLVRSIHDEERVVAQLEATRAKEEGRIREEAEAARMRGNVFIEKGDHGMALKQYLRALDLVDSLGDDAWDGGPWPHRKQVTADVEAIRAMEGEGQ